MTLSTSYPAGRGGPPEDGRARRRGHHRGDRRGGGRRTRRVGRDAGPECHLRVREPAQRQFRGSGSPTSLVDGGGARSASDKVFQHNGAGTLTVQNFPATNFGTFYRSCGNCSTQYRRNVVIRNVTLTRPGNTVAGINTNYGDTARFSGITIVDDSSRSMVICRKYTGNDDGDEPTQVGTGADGTNCKYSASDLTYR